GATLEQNIRAVQWAHEAGLSVRADFIIGTPGETEESLKKTLDFALRMKLEYAHFNKFVPYPGTELYHRLMQEGYAFDFTRGYSITDSDEFSYVPSTISDVNFYKDFVTFAHKRFYLRPAYIVRRLGSIKTVDELYGQIKGFFSLALLR
ncbi:MAG: hypothetical protein KBA46_05610, partial [Candidatus Omnitrophica bacterium]|nr:hypothetical protein [Candidatus Omnitrophota bacterium]